MSTIPSKGADPLFHLAFNNSAQPNIISIVSTGKIIIANKAACTLLGYSRKELLTKNRASIFDIKDSGFKKMLKTRTAEGRSTATVKLIRKTGKTIICEIKSAVFTGEHGIKQSITSIANLTAGIKKQQGIDAAKDKIVATNIDIAKKSADNKKKIVAKDIAVAIHKQKVTDLANKKLIVENAKIASDASKAKSIANMTWIKYIAKASYDVMWDWDIVTGNVYIGDSIEEIFGYKIKNNSIAFKRLQKVLLTAESLQVVNKMTKILKSAKNTWSDSFSIKKMDGSIATVTSRGSIVRNSEGKAIRMIGATQDISKLRKLEEHANVHAALQKDTEDLFHLAAKLSYDGIWDWNIVTNEFYLGEGFEHLFGYSADNEASKGFNWVDFLHPDDKEAVEKGFANAISSKLMTWEDSYRIVKLDGTVANVFGRASIIRDSTGKATRMIGAIHDLSRQKELEEKLEEEIRLKEKQINDAMSDANESARSDIGKELHDNVNQLLGVSKLFLEMGKRGGADSQMHLNESSKFTVQAIEEIRKLSKGLSTDSIQNLGLCHSIDNLATVTMEVNPVQITRTFDHFVEGRLNDKFKLNVFRIIQEQLNNIVKHAQAKHVSIQLSQNKDSIILIVKDDGIGFDQEKKRNGVGVDNIKSRAASFNGQVSIESAAGKGCMLTVTFIVSPALLVKS